MYLLTYEQWPLTESDTAWRPVFIGWYSEAVATKDYGHFVSLADDFPSQLRNVELFERRDNDWIRIRPEAG